MNITKGFVIRDSLNRNAQDYPTTDQTFKVASVKRQKESHKLTGLKNSNHICHMKHLTKAKILYDDFARKTQEKVNIYQIPEGVYPDAKPFS